MPSAPYPAWKFFPSTLPAPVWASAVLGAFNAARAEIDSLAQSGVTSNEVLAAVCVDLEAIGFEVEAGPGAAGRISRPVLFGDNGEVEVEYAVDAYHDEHRVVVEVEAGRGAANNADYRDLVRTSLMVDADYLVLAMMLEYRSGSTKWHSYDQTRRRLNAVYASDRLRLPLDGILLVGY